MRRWPCRLSLFSAFLPLFHFLQYFLDYILLHRKLIHKLENRPFVSYFLRPYIFSGISELCWIHRLRRNQSSIVMSILRTCTSQAPWTRHNTLSPLWCPYGYNIGELISWKTEVIGLTLLIHISCWHRRRLCIRCVEGTPSKHVSHEGALCADQSPLIHFSLMNKWVYQVKRKKKKKRREKGGMFSLMSHHLVW